MMKFTKKVIGQTVPEFSGQHPADGVVPYTLHGQLVFRKGQFGQPFQDRGPVGDLVFPGGLSQALQETEGIRSLGQIFGQCLAIRPDNPDQSLGFILMGPNLNGIDGFLGVPGQKQGEPIPGAALKGLLGGPAPQ